MPVIADGETVREIDVIAINLGCSGDWSQWTAVPGDVLGTWINEQVDEVLDLVAGLPTAEQMRCFVPRFAVRLRSGLTVLAEVAFCFRCRNAMGIPSLNSPTTPRWFAFDPDSEPAQELLRRFRALGPSKAND